MAYEKLKEYFEFKDRVRIFLECLEKDEEGFKSIVFYKRREGLFTIDESENFFEKQFEELQNCFVKILMDKIDKLKLKAEQEAREFLESESKGDPK